MNPFYWILLFLGFVEIRLIQATGNEYQENSEEDSSEHGTVEMKVKNNCTCGHANKDVLKFPGLKPGDINVYPMIAGMVHLERNMIICAATIITNRHVITSNGCLRSYRPTDMGVHVGKHRYDPEENKKDLLEPEQFIVQENTSNQDDIIGVVLLKKQIIFNAFIGPVCLPKDNLSYGGKTVKLFGWKRTELQKGTPVDVLLKSNVKVQTNDDCKKSYPKLPPYALCTNKKINYPCTENFGGPILWVDPDTNRYVAVGIMVQYKDCSPPIINIDITYFLPWVQRVISQTDPTLRTCAKQ